MDMGLSDDTMIMLYDGRGYCGFIDRRSDKAPSISMAVTGAGRSTFMGSLQ